MAQSADERGKKSASKPSFTLKTASDIKDIKSVLTYVTLHTNGFENGCNFVFSFLEVLPYIAAYEAIYPLLKFSKPVPVAARSKA